MRRCSGAKNTNADNVLLNSGSISLFSCSHSIDVITPDIEVTTQDFDVNGACVFTQGVRNPKWPAYS